jgi:predicted ATP-grasp superfamily ATP-dependent carboligase
MEKQISKVQVCILCFAPMIGKEYSLTSLQKRAEKLKSRIERMSRGEEDSSDSEKDSEDEKYA